MLILAVSLYLPHHLGEIMTKAWFYYSGETGAAQAQAMGMGAGPEAGRVEL